MNTLQRTFPELLSAAFLAMLAVALAACTAPGMGRPDPNQAHGAVNIATSVPPTGMHRVVLQDVDGKKPSGAGASNVPPHISLMVVDTFFLLRDARSDFDLPPGEHTLGLTAVINKHEAQMFAPNSGHADKGAGTLKLTVQEGKRYYIAAKVNDIQPDKWEAVVYKVEDIEDYGKPKG